MLKKTIISSAVFCSLSLFTETLASGYQILEQSVTGLGRSYAGGALSGDDLSSAFYNPAEMFYIKGNATFQVGAIYVNARGKYKDKGSSRQLNTATGTINIPSPANEKKSGTFSKDSAIPHAYFVNTISPNVKIGLSIASPFGLATDYSRNWVGKYHALESSIYTLDFNPSIAYKVNDKFHIGFGISAQKAGAVLSQAVYTGQQTDGHAKIKGDDVSFGYNFGFAYSVNESTRVSFSYRSKISHTLEGTRRLLNVGARSGKTDASARVTLPETITISGLKSINDKLDIMASARWTNWSRFKELRVSYADGSRDSATQESWKDSWSFSIGANYQYSPEFMLRAGIMYDQTPVPDSEHRTPRIPDGDRVWLSTGVSYKPTKNMNIDFGYSHIFISDGNMNNTVPIAATQSGIVTDSLVGKMTSTDADLIGFQFSWNF